MDGVLMTNAALAKLLSDHEGRLRALDLEIEKQRRDYVAKRAEAASVCLATVEAEKEKARLAEQGFARERKTYEAALRRCDTKPPWYRSPYLNFLLGTVVAGGVCSGVSIAVTR